MLLSRRQRILSPFNNLDLSRRSSLGANNVRENKKKPLTKKVRVECIVIDSWRRAKVNGIINNTIRARLIINEKTFSTVVRS